MRRVLRTTLVVSLVLLLALLATSCGGSEVKVRTGLRVVCKYGHTIKDTSQFVSVDPDKAKDYRVTEKITVCPLHLRAQRLFAQAQSALARHNKPKAKSLLAKVIAIDPTFEGAAERYRSLGGKAPVVTGSTSANKGSSGSNGSGGGSGGGGGGGGNNPGAQGSYLSRIPKSFSSYRLVSQNEDVLSGTRMFVRTNTTYRVRLLTASVTWIGKRPGFAAWYRQNCGAKYAAGAKSIRVGNKAAKFGTDGSKFALIAWEVSGLAFQVEMEARSGSPRSLETDAVSIARKM